MWAALAWACECKNDCQDEHKHSAFITFVADQLPAKRVGPLCYDTAPAPHAKGH
jgi:hypothetical protein